MFEIAALKRAKIKFHWNKKAYRNIFAIPCLVEAKFKLLMRKNSDQQQTLNIFEY